MIKVTSLSDNINDNKKNGSDKSEPPKKNLSQKTPLFSHPDFTVGFGISPNRPIKGSRTLTAGGEFHPAPKIFNYFIILPHFYLICNSFFEKNLANIYNKTFGIFRKLSIKFLDYRIIL